MSSRGDTDGPRLVCPGCADPHNDGRCCRCGEEEHPYPVYDIGRDYRSRTASYKGMKS